MTVISKGAVVVQSRDVGVIFEYDVQPGEMAIYWACYPASQPVATAGQLITQTVPNGVHVTTIAPLLAAEHTSQQFTGLTLGEYYRISAVPWDGINLGLVYSTDTFQTFEIVDVTVTTGAVAIAGLDVSIGNNAEISVTTGALTIAGIDAEINSSTSRVIGTGGVTVTGADIIVGGSTWLEIQPGSTTWVNI